ncbi:MAG: T9SS type A sorting domain-containing protein [Saprospiraceae bacterium]
MKKLIISTFLLLGITLPAFSTTDICGIIISPDSKVAAFANGEQVTVEIDYNTDEAAGVRIYARPFSGGNLTPGYSASGSPAYTGSGTASSSFTINSGTAIVDEIRIEVYTADNSTLLRRCWVPVRFRFGNVGVNTFSFSGDEALSSYLLGENFSSSFQYNVSYPGGVRVFIRPFSNGALTPGYGASGSSIYNGTGASSSSFTINSGKNVRVDALRVTIASADQSVTIDEFFIPVNLYFSTVKITDISTSGSNFPYNNENRSVSFNYSTTEAGGIRIFPRPWTNGDLSPNYAYSGSPTYNGSGTANSTFTITATNQRVDHLSFRVTNSDQTETLLEFLSPVDFTFGLFLVYNIRLCPAPPARLEHGEPINIHWDYYNDQAEDTRVFVRPFSNGAQSPGYSASGSPTYPAGLGSASGFFTINSGDVLVDQLRFKVTNADQSVTFAEYFIPVHYEFGNFISAVKEQNSVVSSLAISPNPVLDQASITLTLNTSGKVQLYLFDIAGKLVAQLGEREFTAAAPETFLLNSGQYGPGTYFVVAQGENFKHTEKLVVVK